MIAGQPVIDKALLASIATGDEAAFALLFRYYAGRLQPFILKFARTQPSAEEIMQETFIRIWMHREQLVEIENLNAWIFRIAANESLKFLRKRLSEKRLVDALKVGPAGESDDAVARYQQTREINQLIMQAVERLPPQRRLVYKMSRQDGMKVQEIADALGLSPNTVKNVLAASQKAIRKYLSACGHILSMLVVL